MWLFLSTLFYIFLESSFYIILGLFFAAFFYFIFSYDFIVKIFSLKNRFLGPFLSSLIGIPIPICSCGVLPLALSFKKNNISTPSIISFLIATPGMNIPAFMITWGIINLPFAILRFLACFLVAFLSGVLQGFILPKDKEPENEQKSFINSLSVKKTQFSFLSFVKKFKEGLRFAFIELFSDIALWMFLGLVLASLFSLIIPDDFFSKYFDTKFSYVLILFVSAPLYICATASTPIAYVLITKGLTIGGALIFLIAGPVTNIASVPILVKFFGKKVTFLYIFSVCFLTLIFGFLLDTFINHYNLINFNLLNESHIHSNELNIMFYIKLFSMIILMILMLKVFYEKILKKGA